MIVCPSCKSEQLNGTLFCSECGNDLQMPHSPTFDLDSNDVPNFIPAAASGAKGSTTQPKKPGANKSAPPARPIALPDNIFDEEMPVANGRAMPVRPNFKLLVLNSGRMLDCPLQENVILGRSDALTGEQPDIDLTADNALELGVSRRHACLTFRESQVFVTDLGSTNRSYINRQAMMRGQPYEVQDGDEVRLGNVIIKIVNNPGAKTSSRLLG